MRHVSLLITNVRIIQVSEGIELDRHYVYKYCSPTRSAIQSGRNPYVRLVRVEVSFTIRIKRPGRDPMCKHIELSQTPTL
eukprot:1363401-Amorphochlora_amoeboformis.AAC.2